MSSKKQKLSSNGLPSKRRRSNPFNFTDPKHIARYERLKKRDMVATRYYDEHALETLGLLEDVCWLFNRGGMRQFIDLRHATYKDITLELLSSFNLELGKSQPGYITFQLLGVHRELTLDQFNEIFTFPQGLDDVVFRRFPKEYDASEFWTAISFEESYDPSTAKATRIRNPCLRFAQRLMASGVFARDDSANVVRATELFFLWAMYNNVSFDPGFYLARQFMSVAASKSGRIVIGGLITPVAMAFGFDPSAHEENRVRGGSERLDLGALEAMKMCRRVGRYVCWKYPNEQELPVPDQVNTTIRDPENLSFQPAIDEEYPRGVRGGNGGNVGPTMTCSGMPPQQHSGDPSTSYEAIATALRSIQEEQVELRGMVASLTSYLHKMSDVLSAWRDWHIEQGFPNPPPPPRQ